MVARTGNHAVGAPAEYYYRSFLRLLLNNEGITAFDAYLGGSGNTADRGIWAQDSGNLKIVARTGIQASGLPTGVTYSGFGDREMLTDNGKLVYYATLTTNSLSAFNGIWSSVGGNPQLVARSGQANPTTPNGVTFEDYGLQPQLNSRGDILFGAYAVGGLSGYWLADTNGLRLRLASDGPAAGTNSGVNFTAQSSVAMNNSDDIAYVGTIAGPGVDSANNSGVWLDRSSNETLIARSGMHAADSPDSLVFSYFGSVDVNDSGQVVFVGMLSAEGTSTTTSIGIWATDRNGDLHLVARTDQLFEVGPGDFRKINYLQFLGNSNASEFNNVGQVAFSARFTDGSSGAFVSNVVAIPESNSGLLLVMSMLVSLGVMRLPRVYI